MRAWGALLVLLAAGCAAPAAPTAAHVCPGPLCDPPAVDPALPSNFTASPPILPAGRTLTYRLDGLYNAPGDVTVVVASAPSGYLLAGASEKDVVESAVWGPRPWQGALDAELDAEGARRFAWPLHEGASWEVYDGVTVTAHVRSVALPNGSHEQGFAIEGANARGRFLRYAYAPSVGFFTEYTSGDKNGTFQHAVLTKVGSGGKPVWFERGPTAEAADGQAPGALNVPAGFDAVVASAGGSAGHAALVPPGAAPWTWDAGVQQSWSYQSLPATQGPWSLAAAAPPGGGFVYLTASAIKWTRAGSAGSTSQSLVGQP